MVEVSKGHFMVQSVPVELSMDHTTVLQAAASRNNAYITASVLQNELHWHYERAQIALDFIVQAGLAWVDIQNVETSYWFPSMFQDCIQA